ncbi:cobalamin B12-binding domain-containing protein [Thiococcus pfennigii]|uniref:cobalamin B12-binding domain-containing protein n=1 Tax=Thiococcus pfennigii TaxID=1057 RepID=UPI00190512F2|nr:cobalamin-dependent protein [Thiococcus pfennigii]MBK1731010.1 cobalamin-binding protein [Thiococcus pfennigii]
MEPTATLSDLVAQSSRLARVPAAAAEAYRSVMQAVVVEVTEVLAADPRYSQYLGGNPPPLAENHRNHAQFMDEVLTSGRYDLLAVTLPWLYHAYRARGVHYDYFPAELRLWQRAIAKTLPPEAAAPINAVYDWMLEHHGQFVALAEQRAARPPDRPPVFADLLDVLTEALLGGDDARVLALCRGVKDGGASLPELLQHLIHPILQRVGELWEDGRISVADEHQATAIVNRVLGALYYEETFPDQVRGRALVASSLNQLHEIGAWMVATCLELDGWDVDYLGANVPPDALLQKARRVQPDLIALSIAMAFSLRETRALIAALRAQLPGVKILIGGQAFVRLPALVDDMGADAYQPDCAAAVQWARVVRRGESR